MVLLVQRQRPPGIGAAVPTLIIRMRSLVRCVIGIGEFVILGFGKPAERDAEALPEPDLVTFEVATQVLEKEPVVANLVGRNVAADLLQNRLLHTIAQRRVI